MIKYEKSPWYENPRKYWGAIAATFAIGACAIGGRDALDKGPQQIKYPASADYIGVSDYRSETILGDRIDQGASFIFDREDAADIERLDCDGGRKQIVAQNPYDMAVVCLEDGAIFGDDRKLVVTRINE